MTKCDECGQPMPILILPALLPEVPRENITTWCVRTHNGINVICNSLEEAVEVLGDEMRSYHAAVHVSKSADCTVERLAAYLGKRYGVEPISSRGAWGNWRRDAKDLLRFMRAGKSDV